MDLRKQNQVRLDMYLKEGHRSILQDFYLWRVRGLDSESESVALDILSEEGMVAAKEWVESMNLMPLAITENLLWDGERLVFVDEVEFPFSIRGSVEASVEEFAILELPEGAIGRVTFTRDDSLIARFIHPQGNWFVEFPAETLHAWRSSPGTLHRNVLRELREGWELHRGQLHNAASS